MAQLTIQYRFVLPGNDVRDYALRLDGETLEQLDNRPETLPPWTALDFNRCRNCPLEARAQAHCPVAVSLVRLVDMCADLHSYDQIDAAVTTPERTIFAATTAQRAISSLLGLVVATSGCPHTVYFKPMARFHLPLASEEETLYRATSMYLLAQYFLARRGRAPDLELHGLTEIYRNMQVVNQAMAERLRAGCARDGAVNAIVLLDLFAKALPQVIDDSLEELRYLFEAYSAPRA